MPGDATKDISAIVWIGCMVLLFLAVSVYEGWFSGNASPIKTSGSVNPSGTENQTTGTYDGGVYNDPDLGALPNYGG